MAEQIIISLNDINDFWPLSKNIDGVKVNANILRAQQSDLKPILGDPLYFAFIEDYNGTGFDTPIYEKLFNGGNYTYKGNDIYFSGVRALLCGFAFIRIAGYNKINVVRSGVVIKENDFSEPAEDFQVRAMTRKTFEETSRLEGELLQFLDTSRADYPLFNQRITTGDQRRTGYNFYKV